MVIAIQRFSLVFLTALTLVFAVAATAQAGKQVFQSSGAAIRGYDPVAYFTVGKPTRGSAKYTVDWNGATWRFANADNLSAFKKNPEKFAPQYGGYCAWAVSQGYTASTDPDAWDIVDGKLYLNYSKGVQRTWKQNKPGNIVKGDQNWPGLLADLTN